MQKPLMQPLDIVIGPSPLLLGLQSAITIGSLVAIGQLSLAWPLKLIAGTGIVATTVYFIMRDALLILPWSWHTIRVDSQGVLTLTNRRGDANQPQLAATTFIHPQLIILNEKRAWFARARPPVLLLANQTTRQHHRRLRLWLLWWNKQAG